MNYSSYYKIGSVFLSITSIGLLMLIVWPFTEPVNVEKAVADDTTVLMYERDFHEELRMHRDLYMRVSTSNNPVINDELKSNCRDGIKTIDQVIYEENLTYEQEVEVRRKLHAINEVLSKNMPGYIAYYSE